MRCPFRSFFSTGVGGFLGGTRPAAKHVAARSTTSAAARFGELAPAVAGGASAAVEAVLAGHGPCSIDGAREMSSRETKPLHWHLAAIANGTGEIAQVVATAREDDAPSASSRGAPEAAIEPVHSMTRYLAHISHEARTPLNAVIGFAEVLSAQLYGPLGHPKYLNYAKTIEDSGAHLLSIINDILDMSKADAGMLELDEAPVDVCQSIASCLRMMGGRAEDAGVALESVCPDDLVALRGDARKLKQALINLVSNAIEFTPDGGSVDVEAGVEPGGELVISRARHGRGHGCRRHPDGNGAVRTGAKQPHSALAAVRAWACRWSRHSSSCTAVSLRWPAFRARERPSPCAFLQIESSPSAPSRARARRVATLNWRCACARPSC